MQCKYCGVIIEDLFVFELHVFVEHHKEAMENLGIVPAKDSTETPDLLRSISRPDGVLIKALDGSQQARENCLPNKKSEETK